MAYADQSMSGNRVTALIIVALIHVVLGYALVTGLAYEAAKKVIQRVTTVDIKEEVKEEEGTEEEVKEIIEDREETGVVREEEEVPEITKSLSI